MQAAQLRVVARDYQVPVDQANQVLETATAALNSDRAALSSAAHAARVRAAAVTSDLRGRWKDRAGHARAVRAHRGAVAALRADRRGLRAIAVALYVGSSTAPAGVAGGRGSLSPQKGVDAAVGLAVAESTTGTNAGHDAARVSATARQEARFGARIHADEAQLRVDRARRKAARTAVAGAKTKVAAAMAGVGKAQVRLTAARHAQAAAEAAVDPPELQAKDPSGPLMGGPSILGPPALDAAQLLGWFNQSGYTNHAKAKISQLIDWYLANGAIEGVRGDVAFAQAILETAGFSSPDAIARNNYAGIGHCDACGAGDRFASPRDGVIGQLELLRTYADASSDSGLPQPLALQSLDPATEVDRGCCGTWNSLTGKWASDPAYGPRIMEVYLSMLDYALSQPPVAPGTTVTPSAAPRKTSAGALRGPG